MQAANWFATNSALYREQGVSFSEDRISSYNVNLPQSETDSSNLSQVNYQMNSSCNVEDTAGKCKQLDDGWTEIDAEMPAGISDTMLRGNVPKNQRFSKYRGNSQKINSAHILRLGRP